MSLPLEGKVALVTGASRGICRADALGLAKAGADIVVTDILVEEDEQLQKTTELLGPMAQVMAQTNVIYTKSTAEQIRALGRRSAALSHGCDEPGRSKQCHGPGKRAIWSH